MCGIAGILSGRPVDPELLGAMANALVHRGPDDSGVWLGDDRSVALAHRRLSIVDLSPSGHQPMQSHCGRYVLVYNGEIYNHAALRRELEQAGGSPRATGRDWRGHSDTETLLEALAHWGGAETLLKCVGMFALALWDKRERRLTLARDRFGEKPLYYGWTAGRLVFASEVGALKALSGFDNPISHLAVSLYAGRGYVPEPYSIYERVYKVPPGSIITLAADAWREPHLTPPDAGAAGLDIERFWSYPAVVAEGMRRPFESEDEALDALDAALMEAIAGQAVADVPVGAFLSGGIDSSTVVAYYQKHSPGAVRTFSIGFEEGAFNEAKHARAVAAHLGTDHHELYVSAADARETIPLMSGIYGEPFADSSQIPTFLVSRFARSQVTVALSGDAGDELFGGYNRYVEAARVWDQLKRLPPFARLGIGSALGALPAAAWNQASALLPGGKRQPHFGSKVRRALRSMGAARDLDDVYSSFVDEWSGERRPIGQAPVARIPTPLDFAPKDGEVSDSVRMMMCDALTYLPGDILCKVDRAAMAVSLETRVPFLDHRVAAVAARIPIAMKIGRGQGKAILRKLLYRHVPAALFDRPKAGFGIPVGEWLRGPLREWAEELLSERRLREDGFFDPGVVRSRWHEHLSGKAEAAQALWPVLMFSAWMERGATASQSPPSRRPGEPQPKSRLVVNENRFPDAVEVRRSSVAPVTPTA